MDTGLPLFKIRSLDKIWRTEIPEPKCMMMFEVFTHIAKLSKTVVTNPHPQ